MAGKVRFGLPRLEMNQNSVFKGFCGRKCRVIILYSFNLTREGCKKCNTGRSRGPGYYSPMFTKPETNNCFSVDTLVIAWKKFKKSQKIQIILNSLFNETNVKVVFSHKTIFISILRWRYNLKIVVHQVQ